MRASTGEHSLRASMFSKHALKDEYTRRKYARFQEDRYTNEEDKEVEAGHTTKKSGIRHSRKSEDVKKNLDARRGRLLERLHIRSKRAAKAKETESATDILYENQRGWFLFGYPLYSSRSLLNLDPASWTNAEFEDSPVDIRNAQLPDPTWAWAWKRWYVDMTDDVDEEGWQYSLSFGRRFSWHGTHPWFHSAVRRRRWLRKRVKIAPHHATENKAHELSQDYFTIHSARRESSRGSSADRNTSARRSSFFGIRSVDDDSESEEEDITNVASLLTEMKETTIDRKKLDAVQNFVAAGGDELSFLTDAVPEVLSMFMYQNSRRQMLAILENAVHEVKDQRKEKGKDPPPRSPGGGILPPANTPLRVEGLKKSIHAVHENIKEVEYFSDVRAMEQQFHEHDEGHPAQQETSDISSAKDQSGPRNTDTNRDNAKRKRLDALDINDEISAVEIKGIPNSAGVDVEPGILRPLGFMKDEGEGEMGVERGKGKGRDGKSEAD